MSLVGSFNVSPCFKEYSAVVSWVSFDIFVGGGKNTEGAVEKLRSFQAFLWRSRVHQSQFRESMILVRLLSSPIRVGFNTSAVRAEKHWEKVAFKTARVFAIFGLGVSTMGLTQLAMYRGTPKLQWSKAYPNKPNSNFYW